MTTALIIISAVLGGLALLFLVVKVIFARVRRRLLRRLFERFSENDLRTWTVNANFFGLESKGGRQVRGNASLAMTDRFLYSCLGAPIRELAIPLERVTRVSLVKSHCGKSVMVYLLRVDFTTTAGEDAAAWFVRDAAEWMEAIESAANDLHGASPAPSG